MNFLLINRLNKISNRSISPIILSLKSLLSSSSSSSSSRISSIILPFKSSSIQSLSYLKNKTILPIISNSRSISTITTTSIKKINDNIKKNNQQYQSIRNMGCKRFLKTKQSAAKRFIVTGKGKLKFTHQGKAHLNGHKSRKQIRRLNTKGRLSGTMEKNMKKLLLG